MALYLHQPLLYFLDFFPWVQCLSGCGYNLRPGTKRGYVGLNESMHFHGLPWYTEFRYMVKQKCCFNRKYAVSVVEYWTQTCYTVSYRVVTNVVYEMYWSLAIQYSREYKKFPKRISIHSNCSFMKPKQQTTTTLECSLHKQEVVQLSSLMMSTLVCTAIHTLLLSRK